MTRTKTDTSHIRRLDEHSDLLQVADLIELCFEGQMDPDGREYIRQIRRAAHDVSYLRWVPGASERVCMPLNGYIWKEDNRVIGNITLIPYKADNRWLYLIANVAVHPDFRRGGIGRELTMKALDHISKQGASAVWLQVREDNPNAIQLYHQLGFLEKARRTIWQSHDIFAATPHQIDGIRVMNRSKQDWIQQREWLSSIYPHEIAWYLSFDLKRLDVSFWHNLFQWLDGTSIKHWSAYHENELIAGLSWEPSSTYSDILWLATTEKWEDMAIRTLLPYTHKTLTNSRSLAINYPAGRGKEAFEAIGFEKLNTLIWMSIDYRPGTDTLNNKIMERNKDESFSN